MSPSADVSTPRDITICHVVLVDFLEFFDRIFGFTCCHVGEAQQINNLHFGRVHAQEIGFFQKKPPYRLMRILHKRETYVACSPPP
jgi:hypothetical protein